VRAEALGDTESAAQAQLRRFEREAQATALLTSQHSIRLFDFGAADDGSFYYVMELLSGRDLESIVKLDFGLVQTRTADPASADTETLMTAQTLIGTPAYMAPEVILGHHDVDKRADVYALGCVAFYLLTGTRVFQEGTQMQTLVDHVHASPVAPSARLPVALPRAVDDLVLSCLKKDPVERRGDQPIVEFWCLKPRPT
jgi:serine/threonine-protein kinase